MSVRRPRGTSTRRLVAVVVAATAVAGVWLVFQVVTRQHYRFDQRTFDSVEALGSASDEVVVGVVVGVRGRFVDRGGDPEFDEYGDRIPGIPMVVYDLEIDRTLKGSSSPGTLVPVAMVDMDEASAEGVSRIDTGAPVVLFLTSRTTETAPDIETVADQVWVVVSGDIGVFDVEGQAASPRSTELTRLSSDAAPELQFELRSIEDALTS